MALLTRIEEFISRPMELFHNQKGFQPVDLNRMALRQMERGCRRGIRQTYAPNHFTVRLNPADLKDLAAFLDVIRSEIKGELRRVVEERQYLLAGELEVEISNDPKTPAGQPRVEARMNGGVDLNSEDEIGDQPIQPEDDRQPELLRDAKTILAEPEADSVSTVDAVFEENTRCVKEAAGYDEMPEGQGDDGFLEETVRSRAALFLAMEMMNHGRTYAGCRRGEAPRRIEWKKQAVSAAASPPEPSEGLGRLHVRGENLVLHITSRGIFAEYIKPDPSKRASSWMLLENGSEVRIGSSIVEYQSGLKLSTSLRDAGSGRPRVIHLPVARNEKDV